MSSDPSRWPEGLAAVLLAWAGTGAILLASASLARLLKRHGPVAIEPLVGTVPTAIATTTVLLDIADSFDL